MRALEELDDRVTTLAMRVRTVKVRLVEKGRESFAPRKYLESLNCGFTGE